jgi:osmoprotectant transport system substrate-binding protein
MKKAFAGILLFFILLSPVEACVGKLLYIGSLNSPFEQILAEMLSSMISERTGTTVSIRYYSNAQELYSAVKKKEVHILVENTDRSLEALGRTKEEDARTAYDISKEEFRKKFDLVWLQPFSPLTGHGKGRSFYVPAVAVDVLTNFPALPRVLNKLGGMITDDVFDKMVQSSRDGESPKKTARDFLKTKRLI